MRRIVPIGRLLRRYRWTGFSISLLASIYGLYILLIIIQAYNSSRPVEPVALLHYPPRAINLRFPATPTSEGLPNYDTELFCHRFCVYFNPAMIRYRSRTLVAFRESTRQQCAGIMGFAGMLAKSAVSAISSVVYGEAIVGGDLVNHSRINDGELDTRVDRIATSQSRLNIDVNDKQNTDDYPPAANQQALVVKVLGRIRDKSTFDPGAWHQGMEDPRWLLDNENDRLFILTTIERGLPRLFLTELQDQGPGRPFGYRSDNPSVELSPQFETNYAQKNWMFIPYRHPSSTSSNSQQSDLIFALHLTPLHLVHVNPADGKTYTYYQQSELEYRRQWFSDKGMFTLSGSTQFIPIKDSSENDGAQHFLGVAHRNLPHSLLPGGIQLRQYESYFIRLTVDGAGDRWIITAISDPIILPNSEQPTMAHRVHFISSLVDAGDDFYDLTFGYMDCSSHIVSLPKRLVLEDMLKYLPSG